MALDCHPPIQMLQQQLQVSPLMLNTQCPLKAYFWTRYADRTDKLLIFFGTLGAIANGVTLPMFTFVFGK